MSDKKPRWWTESYEQMRTPLERFEYLTGLSDLSWDDCCDAWLEAKRQIPEVTAQLAAARAEVEEMKVEHAVWEKHSLVQIVSERDALRAEVAALRENLAASKWRERQWNKTAKSWMRSYDELKDKYEPTALEPSALDAARGDKI